MTRNLLYTTSLLLMLSISSSAQLYNKGEKYKAGIKAGMAVNSMTGGALKAGVKGGFHAGLYYRSKLGSGNKNHLLLDGAVAFRGASYRYGIEQLNKINVVMVEVPVSFMRTLWRTDDNALHLFGGGGPAFLIQSEAYLDAEIVPILNDLPMYWFNATGVAGLHFDTYYCGFQLAFKVNPRNLLTGGEFKNEVYTMKPQPNFSRSLYPWSVELGVYF